MSCNLSWWEEQWWFLWWWATQGRLMLPISQRRANRLSQLQSLCTLSCSCGLTSLLPVWPHSCMSSELTYSGYLSYRFHQTETFLHLWILWFTSIALRKFQYLFCFFSWGKTQAQTLASLFSVECLAGLRKDVIPQLHAVGYMIKSQSHYASWMQVSES